jgi:hypothetical protein
MDFKKYPDVTFVGEETSGKPNHFGEVQQFVLPNSGLTVNYSTKYFMRTEELISTITPDVILSLSIADYLEGRDLSFEWVMEQ